MRQVPVAPQEVVQKGRYVKWHKGHFVAVIVDESVVVMDGDSRVTVRTPEEAGRGHDHIWYRLVPSDTESSAGRRLEPDVQLYID